jgi:hypothetical protein
MNTATQRWALCLFLLPGILATPARAAPPQAILLEFDSPERELREVWTQPDRMPQRMDVSLELGDEAGGSVLRLLPDAGDADSYRVSVQFETSAGISGEGPHIDLLDWKHCRSDWRPAEPVGNSGFRLPVPRNEDDTCFPQATRAELREAVERALGEYGMGTDSDQRWLGLADQVPRVGEFPSYIAISTVRVRIERHDGRSWRLLTTIDFRIPMGC